MTTKGTLAYCTKWALSTGIREVLLTKRESYAFIDLGGYTMCVSNSYVHDTLEAAQSHAAELAQCKLKSLDKQRAKLERIALGGGCKVQSKGNAQ